jgi:hypothetical protein
MINVQSTQVTVYNWFDIQKALCEVMGIDEKHFRDYHKVVGGDYKDFWHVCLETIVPDNMHNDTVVTMFSWDSEDYYEDADAWKNLVLKAWNTVYNELDKSGTHSGIEVRFSW